MARGCEIEWKNFTSRPARYRAVVYAKHTAWEEYIFWDNTKEENKQYHYKNPWVNPMLHVAPSVGLLDEVDKYLNNIIMIRVPQLPPITRPPLCPQSHTTRPSSPQPGRGSEGSYLIQIIKGKSYRQTEVLGISHSSHNEDNTEYLLDEE